jgi:hypothetical protein
MSMATGVMVLQWRRLTADGRVQVLGLVGAAAIVMAVWMTVRRAAALRRVHKDLEARHALHRERLERELRAAAPGRAPSRSDDN